MWALLAAGLPWTGGCNEDPSSSSSDVGSLVKPVLAVASPDDINAAVDAKPTDAETKLIEEKPAPAGQPLPAEQPTPPDVRLSLPLTEIVKLAQAGVDDSVMLAYITNSAYTFNLGSDQIIYLNDLGVSSEVITALIQHDQDLSRTGAGLAPAPTTPLPESVQSKTVAQTPTVVPTETTNAPQYAPTYAEPPAQPQQANVSYSYFYDSLAPYGNWINVDNYGMCWQPTVVVVNHSWRPYCDRGRWMYTDCGWYWYSDYSWGWAPFHYGRWFSHPRWGWCWNPGYTWGPAWVTWRYTDSHCGWAPLPPAARYSAGLGFTYYGSSVGISFGFGLGYDCYSFVPWGRFCDYRPYRHCLPPHQVRQVYGNSTVINNVIVGNNNTIINGGIPPERVRTYTRTEIRRTTLRDAPAPAGGVRGERLAGDGRMLMVHRPRISEATASPAATVRSEPTRGELRRPISTTPAGLTDTRPARIIGDSRERVSSPQPAVPGGLKHEERRGAGSITATPTRPESPGLQPGPTANPTREPSRARGTDAQPGTRTRDPASGNKAPSIIMRGSDQPARPTPTPTPAPPVAPRSGQNQSSPPASVSVPTRNNSNLVPSPANSAPAPQRPVPTLSHTWTTPSPPPSQRQEVPRITRGIEDRSASSPSSRVFSMPEPRSSAPAAPLYSPRATPSPTPRSAPMPSYTPRPAPSTPSPAMSTSRAPAVESRSMPAPSPRASSPPPSSSSSRSESGGRSHER